MSRKRKKSKVTLENSTALDFRYGDKWAILSTKAREQCVACCNCLVKEPSLVHHVRYVDKKGELLLDNVKPGKDIFPLCKTCHMRVHSNKNWIEPKEGKEYHHNTETVVNRLEIGWQIIVRDIGDN